MSSVLEALPFDVLASILCSATLRDVAAMGRCSRRLYEETNDMLYKLDANSPDRIALHWASLKGNLSTAEKSMAAGSPVNAPCDARLEYRWFERLGQDRFIDRYASETALDASMRNKHEDLILYLAKMGGKISDYTVFDFVIRDGCENLFSLLAWQLLSNDHYLRTGIGSHLNLAVYHDRESMFDRLQLHIPAVDANRYNEALLTSAASRGSLRWTQKLVEMGLTVEDTNAERVDFIWTSATMSNAGDSLAVCDYWERLHPWVRSDYMTYDRGYHFRDVCGTGNVPMARRLLQFGAQPNSVRLIRNPHTANCPLDFAIQSRNSDMVRLLFENGADWKLSDRESEPETVLLFACRFSTVEIVKMLLDRGINPRVELVGANCMHFAIMGRNTDMIMYLVSQGFNVPEDALLLAWRQKDWQEIEVPTPEFIKLLLDLGAKTDVRDAFGYSPVALAIKHMGYAHARQHSGDNVFQIVKLLLSHGAEAGAFSEGDGRSELDGACRGSVELVDCLLQHNPRAHILDNSGYTMLHEACLENNLPVVKLLLERGVDATGKGAAEQPSGHKRLNTTPIEEACVGRNGTGGDRAEILRLLLAQGVPYERELLSHCLYSLCSSQFADIQSFRLLLDHGADPKWTFPKGRTILHEACKNAHAAYVKILLEAGADVHAVCDSHRTPFDEPLYEVGFSKFQVCVAVVELLLSYGSGTGSVQVTDDLYLTVPGLEEVLRKYIDLDTWEASP